MDQPEPWLRGPIEGVEAAVMPVFFSFAQVREDLAKYVADLTPEQLWEKTNSGSIGFHLRHLAGSVDRLTTYLMGDQLSQAQLQVLKRESEGTADAATLLAVVDEALRDSERRLRTLDPDSLYEARSVGRKALPTSVLGLIVHLAEHTQRHLGQVITLCKATQSPA
ncbi:MAG TPA: DinB family protein [Bryobacteraceae bacterium]|jgi:uncharacterized damage-inducible protein DinB|nr:DinB family protein [Bryobacteraceae bacterium]